jgi:hypothetical protein
MKTFLPSFVLFLSLFFIVGCDFQSSKTNDLNSEKKEIVDSLSFEELVELKDQNWETRLRSDNGYYSYVYNNDSLIFVEQKLCDQEGYPVDGIYGLYFQPFEETPCYYTWFSAENYFSENQEPDFVARIKDYKISAIMSDKMVRSWQSGDDIREDIDLDRLIGGNSKKNKNNKTTERVEAKASLESFPKELIGEWASNSEWYKQYGAEFSIEKTKLGYELYYQRGRGKVIDINKIDNAYMLHSYSDGSGEELIVIEFKLTVNDRRLSLIDSHGNEAKLVKFN